MSPETADSNRTSDERSDLWSLGITLIEMLDGFAPEVPGDTQEQKASHIASLKTGPRWSRRAHPSLCFLVDQVLLNVQPKFRGTAYQLENVSEKQKLKSLCIVSSCHIAIEFA